jgi:hypothetical protein
MEPPNREPGQLWKYNENSPEPSSLDGSLYLILSVDTESLTCQVLHKELVRRWPWSLMTNDTLLSAEPCSFHLDENCSCYCIQ